MEASLFYRLLGKGASPNAIHGLSEQLAMQDIEDHQKSVQKTGRSMLRRPGESDWDYTVRLMQQLRTIE